MAGVKAMIETGARPAVTLLKVDIDPALIGYASNALVRLGYLYPDAVFEAGEAAVSVTGPITDIAVMRREVLHATYRERIYAETLPLRRRLLDGLLAR